MSDERTSLQLLADAFDSYLYTLLRDVESAAKTYPDAESDLRSAATSLRAARPSLRKLMHDDDVRTTS